MSLHIFSPLTPKIILAVGAHADDIDGGAACTIAQWIKDGAIVYYAVVTDGSRGSSSPDINESELIAEREAEQRAAAQLLGVKDVFFLGHEDGALEVTMELKGQLVELIRKLKPDTVLSLDPTESFVSELGFINHPDHRATGQATLDAVYPLARDCLSFPEQCEEGGLEPYKVDHVLLINVGGPNYLVDISDSFDLKLQTLQKHASQTDDTATIQIITRHAEHLGRKLGVQYAEGFTRIDITE
jgi:LmbE family N-acetylglucosaminyl deacetylase